MPRALRGDEHHVVAGRGLDLPEVEVEAVAGHQHGALLEIRLDRRFVDVGGELVGEEDVDQIGLLDRILDAHRLEAVLLGELIVRPARPLGDDDLEPAVTEVLGLRVPLAAVADDGDGLAIEGLEISVGVVIDRGGQGITPRDQA